ncbi:MAG TPA: SDR family oxidoreductase [Vicinamibacterales bacterium]|nr:SDR family oxidoreductase [Vicinamibacterales bacterium]
MELQGKLVVVTGGANGIGRALCRRFATEGAKGIVVADVDAGGAARVAKEVSGLAIATDVTREADVRRLVEQTIERFGAIDLFCSNAGIAVDGGEATSDAEWQRCWDVNVMAHVYAARAVLPSMLARGGGYLLQTVSAAGLLTHIHSATYAVTKHAALAFAEWIAVAYGDRGIKVSALCPQGVKTDMLRRAAEGGREFLLDTAVEPEKVAADVASGIRAERFLILPHPEVAEFVKRKASDPDRWLSGMRRLRAKYQL